MSTALQDTIEKEIIVKAPIEFVYSAITDPEKIVKWFPDGLEGKLEPGERAVLDFGEDGKAGILVVAANPHDYFAYRWVPGSCSIPDAVLGDAHSGTNTLVEFRLEATSEGTKVKLKESGFASLPAAYYEQAMKDNTGGWNYMIDRLETYLAQG